MSVTITEQREHARLEGAVEQARKRLNAAHDELAAFREQHPRYIERVMGDRIRGTRLEMNLSQVMLARMAGVAPSTLCAIENGRRSMSMLTMMRLVAITGVSTEWLFTGEGKKHLTADEQARAARITR